MRFILFLVFCFVITLPTPSIAAGCAPVPGGAVCLDKSCDTVGATTIDSDQKNIIACLKNDNGTSSWRSTTSSGGTNCNISFIDRTGFKTQTTSVSYKNMQSMTFSCNDYYQFSSNSITRSRRGDSPGFTCSFSGFFLVQCQNGSLASLGDTCSSFCSDNSH